MGGQHTANTSPHMEYLPIGKYSMSEKQNDSLGTDTTSFTSAEFISYYSHKSVVVEPTME
jgi:hypothetical protein